MTVEKRAEQNRAAKRRDRGKKCTKPTEIHVVEFPDGEFKPLFVSAAHVDKVILGRSTKAFANDRCLKKGCRYYLVGGKPFYKITDLEYHYGKNPVETFND